MRGLWKGNRWGKVCIPIVETTEEKALRAIKEANRMAEIIELRVDYLDEFDLARLLKGRQKPTIVTNRSEEEGGKCKENERTRLNTLRQAIDLGAEYIDVEIRSERSLLHALVKNRRKTRIILSSHDLHRTPSPEELRRLFDLMARWGTDVVKIVSFARSREDNLNVLSLIAYARERRQQIVTFCMGERGKISRVIAPLIGASWTYASMNKNRTSAPGQLTVFEMLDIWKRLG